MELKTELPISKKLAYKKWKQYVEALKLNKKDKFLEDMKKIYNQLKSGRKIIDINSVMGRAGLNLDGHPRLAIARWDVKEVKCEYRRDGTLVFKDRFDMAGYNYNVRVVGVFNPMTEDQRKAHGLTATWDDLILFAPVPKVPASIMPGKKTKDYYVLWEVDKWKKEVPKDPWLLRRITPNIFVVVAGWDLTELERSVMKGRLF